MKRILCITLAVLLCIIAQAQNIVGSWKGNPVKEKQNSYVSTNKTDQVFKQDGTFTETSKVDVAVAFATSKTDSLYLNCTTRVSVDGTYTVSGGKLLLNYKYKNAVGKLESINVKSTNPSVQQEIESKMSTIKKIAGGYMEKELKKAYKEVNGEKTILKVTSDVLEYKTKEGVIYTFKKSK
ncbi:MAG: hypothetical protein MJZ09_02175 [Bacteroidales bacterium]|nr:hypothetical protein [Bacteroidales bacterium]